VTERLAIEGGHPTVAPGAHKPWPDITPEDHRAVSNVLKRGRLADPYLPEIVELEARYAAYCNRAHCVALGSGTAALHCALVAAGVNPGDEVITTAYSFSATGMAIRHAGATPVFADIDETYNLDPDAIPPVITARTKAVLAVDIHGLPADMDRIGAIAGSYGLAVIEDAAQAHGATYHGRVAGSLGDSAAFSLNQSKPLQGGDGGLFVSDDPDAVRAVRRMSNFGEDIPTVGEGQTRAFWSHGTGYQYRLPAVSAALALSQFGRLDDYLATARRNAQVLTDGLLKLPGIDPPHVPDGLESSWWKYMVRPRPDQLGWSGDLTELRDRFIYALRAEIGIANTWQRRPLPALPAFRRPTGQPWTLNLATGLLPWRPEDFPRTVAALDSAVVLGSERCPLYVQDEAVMAGYVAGIEKIVSRISIVLTCDYQPLKEVPPPSDDDR
jgi:perosamine synthetase